MDSQAIYEWIQSYTHSNLPFVLAGVALFLLLLYRNRKLALTLLMIGVIVGGIFYLISDMAGKAVSNKKDLTTKTEKSAAF